MRLKNRKKIKTPHVVWRKLGSNIRGILGDFGLEIVDTGFHFSWYAWNNKNKWNKAKDVKSLHMAFKTMRTWFASLGIDYTEEGCGAPLHFVWTPEMRDNDIDQCGVSAVCAPYALWIDKKGWEILKASEMIAWGITGDIANVAKLEQLQAALDKLKLKYTFDTSEVAGLIGP